MIQGFIRGLLVFVIVSQKNTADSFTFIRTGTNHPRQPWEGLAAAAADAASNTPTASFIRFSHCFQRHVVHADSQTVLASYRFLDDALLAFPDTPLIEIGLCNNISTTPTTDVDLVARCIAGAGRQEEFAYRRPAVQMEDDNDNKDKMNEAIEALIGLGWNGGQLGADVAGDRSVRAAIVDCVGAPRLLSHTSETISQNCEAIQALLGRALGMSPSTVRTKSLALFPQLCLCDTKDIAEKLSFLLAPRPPTDLLEKDEDIDWPLLASRGYGLGLSRALLREVLVTLPYLLAVYHEDATQGPSLKYFYETIRVPDGLCREARDVFGVSMDGVTASDICVMAYLKDKGATWDQIRDMVQACPTFLQCDLLPTWDMQQGCWVAKQTFPGELLRYIRKRLQATPSEIQAMIKTFPALTYGGVARKVKPNADTLQDELGLTSAQLRQLLLRSPDLVSMQIAEGAGLRLRLDFFLSEVGMSQEQLGKAVLRQPSLLRHKIDEGLRPKLDFLRKFLGIPSARIPKMITAASNIMTLSLENNLVPMAKGFMAHCDLNNTEFGAVVAREPRLFLANWRSNLLPTMKFVEERAGLSKSQLRSVIVTFPKLPLYSVERNIRPKLDMIEDALQASSSGLSLADMVEMRPRLLQETPIALARRLQYPELILHGRNQRLSRRPRRVLELSIATGEVLASFPSAKYAAAQLNVSTQSVNHLCRNCLEFRGRKYQYEGDKVSPPPPSNIDRATDKAFSGVQSEGVVHLSAWVAGAAYPPDSRDQARGIRRNGGITIYLPQAEDGVSGLESEFGPVASNCFTQLMPSDETNSTCLDQGRILLGFPYQSPSRRRCELYACYEALRLILYLLREEAHTNKDFRRLKYQFDIYAASNYASSVLANITRLEEWGSCQSVDEFSKMDNLPQQWVNKDLLYPVARTYWNMVKTGKLSISFHHVVDGPQDETTRSLLQFARTAAKWQYDRTLRVV